jgi:hypothetical protein
LAIFTVYWPFFADIGRTCLTGLSIEPPVLGWRHAIASLEVPHKVALITKANADHDFFDGQERARQERRGVVHA